MLLSIYATLSSLAATSVHTLQWLLQHQHLTNQHLRAWEFELSDETVREIQSEGRRVHFLGEVQSVSHEESVPMQYLQPLNQVSMQR